MKRSRVTPWNVRPSLIATAVACCFAPTLAVANPTGGVVTAGQATFSTQGKVFTVTNTPGTIINWQGFSIASGERTWVRWTSSSTPPPRPSTRRA